MARSNKKLKATLITIGALVLMAATIPAAIWVTHTQTAELGNDLSRCQTGQHKAYKVIIKNNEAVPNNIVAKQCDTMTFTNLGPQQDIMAFGPHEQHVSYDGVSERLLIPGQSFTINLIQTGTFHFHDHISDLAQGTFTVVKQ